MSQSLPVCRVINLIPEASQRLWTTDESEGRPRLLASDMEEVLEALPAVRGMTARRRYRRDRRVLG